MKKDELLKLSVKEKVYFLLVVIFSILVVILVALGFLNIFPIAITNTITQPILAVAMIFNGLFQLKRKNKIASILFFGCAGFIILSSILVVVIRVH